MVFIDENPPIISSSSEQEKIKTPAVVSTLSYFFFKETKRGDLISPHLFR